MRALIGLVTFTFDHLTYKLVYWLPVWLASIGLNLGFLDLSVLELCRGTQQTDRQTRSIYNATPYRGGVITSYKLLNLSFLRDIGVADHCNREVCICDLLMSFVASSTVLAATLQTSV